MSVRTRIASGIVLVTMLTALIPLGLAFAGGSTTIGPVGMFGAQEVPGPGDPNGEGEATFTLNAATGRVCFDLEWRRIARPMAAHIHRGEAGVAGAIKVTLFSSRRPLPATIKNVGGCVRGVDTDLVQRIIDHPDRYYVNVHNRGYPAGAIRGELAGGPS
jgi:CHRD domain